MANKPKYFSFPALSTRTGHFDLLHILIMLTVLYLFWQVSLGGAIPTAETSEKTRPLSDRARYTVGFGMFLFVFRTCRGKFIPALTLAETVKQRLFWALLPVSAITGWGAMIAEHSIVNHYADRTSGHDRVDAKLILFFNQAFAAGNVTLPDLPQSIAESRIGSRTFAKMPGFAIRTNPALISQIREQTEAILTSLHGRKWYGKIDSPYDAYQENLKKFAEQLSAFAILESRNFFEDSVKLNRQLLKFAQCANEQCRKETQRANRSLS